MAGDDQRSDREDADPGLAKTLASADAPGKADPALSETLASGDIPRTHVEEDDRRPRRAPDVTDPALAPTMTPEVASMRTSRPGHALTSEHPGRYVRQEELGRGGMGRVLVVKDTHLGRDVALKELLDQSMPGNDAMSVGSAARFLREARITGQLEHPGIVPVHELGQRPDGTIYYTMKRIRGRSLASVLKEKTTLADRLTLLGTFRSVCEAVAYAHSCGVVHRDLKPDNVMVGEFGDTLVVDWGLAKVRGEAEIQGDRISGQSGRTSAVDDLARTLDGHAIGTPAYMSPEQARGELGSIDERADVWGLGTILFEILAGRAPYVGTSALDVLAKVIDTAPPRVREIAPDVPAELAAIADRALMRDASSRYPNAGEVAKEIGAYLDGRTVGAYEYSSYELALRFVRRHRAASIAVASVFTSIVVASVLVYSSFLDESRARAIAESARDEAMRERSSAEESMHAAESAVADALLERAERALFEGDASAAAVFAAGVLVREHGSATHGPSSRHVRALSLYLEADARRRYVFERLVPGGHLRSGLSTDGHTIAIPTESAIRLFDLDDGSERRVALHANRVRALGSSGIAVLAGDAPGIYDLASGERLAETPQPMSAQVTDAAILVTGSDGTLLAFSPDGRTELAHWTSRYRGQVRATMSTGAGRVAVISTDTPELELWAWPHTAGDAQRVTLRALPYVAAFSPRGDRVAVLASDFVATMHVPASPTEPPHVHELLTRTWPTAMGWVDDGSLALYENGDHLTLRDPGDGHTLDVIHFPAANGGRIECGGGRIVFFPSESRTTLGDATVLRAAGTGGRDAVMLPAGVRDVQLDTPRHRLVVATLTQLWAVPMLPSGRLGQATELTELPSGVGIVEHVRVLDDGAIAVLTLRDGLVITEGPSWSPTVVHGAEADYAIAVGLRGLAVAPDGDTVFFGAPTAHQVLRWSRTARAESDPIEIPETTVQALAVSPDGAQLVVGGHDGSVRAVRIATGAVEHTIAADDHAISALAFSPRGDRVAVGDQTGRVRLLDASDWHVVQTGQPLGRYVNGLAWSPDGRWVVAASDDPAIVVLAATDLLAARIVRTAAAPISAALGTDGSHLLFHDGRAVVQLDLRMGMTEPPAETLLSQAEQSAGVRLDGLTLGPRDH